VPRNVKKILKNQTEGNVKEFLKNRKERAFD
jgi:hypothetical protein